MSAVQLEADRGYVILQKTRLNGQDVVTRSVICGKLAGLPEFWGQ